MTDLALAPARAAAPATGAHVSSRARRPDRGATPPTRPLRRPADQAPVKQLLHAVPPLPGRVAAPVPARREGAAERGDVPRLPHRRDADPLLPAVARAPRTTRTARAQTVLRSQLEAAARRRERQARRGVGRAPGPAHGAQARRQGAHHRVRGARATARRAGRGAATSRVPARPRDRVDDRGSPGPRDPPPGPGRRGNSSRRSSTTRSRPAARSPRRPRRATRRPACTSPPAGSRAGPPHGSSSPRP